MIQKLQEMLTPNFIAFEQGDAKCIVPSHKVIVTSEEAANIFGVLLSVANLLDSPSVKSKGDLADCLSRGMERMIVATEDISNVQVAWGKLV